MTELLASEKKDKDNMLKKEQEFNSSMSLLKQQVNETEAKVNEATTAERAQASALTHLQKEVRERKVKNIA